MSTTEVPSKILGIQFSILSPEEIRASSVAEFTSRDTYNGGQPVICGLFDPRMGVLDLGLVCLTLLEHPYSAVQALFCGVVAQQILDLLSQP